MNHLATLRQHTMPNPHLLTLEVAAGAVLGACAGSHLARAWPPAVGAFRIGRAVQHQVDAVTSWVLARWMAMDPGMWEAGNGQAPPARRGQPSQTG